MRTFGARLALFAVAVLLTLSFGHMHRDDFLPEAAASAPHGNGAPGKPPPIPDTHDDCAICVTMGMTATSNLPPPLAVPVPVRFEYFAFAPRPALSLAEAPRPPFRSRGPPFPV
jgi:hypothetical protein